MQEATWQKTPWLSRPSPAPGSLSAALPGLWLLLLFARPPVSAQDPYEPNDTSTESAFLGGPIGDPGANGLQTLSTEGGILEAGGASDWFAFTAFANAPISVRLAPLAGEAGAIDARRLSFRLWRRVSAQPEAFQALANAAAPAAGLDACLPPTSFPAAGFLVVEVAAMDGLETEQPYLLQISNRELLPLGADSYEPNDTREASFFLGGPLRDVETHGETLLATDGANLGPNDAPDFYAVTLFEGAKLAARLEPLESDLGPIDARNLALRLWRQPSAEAPWQLLAQIDFNGASEGEYHPPLDYAVTGSMVLEVYSTDSPLTAQAYRLRVSNAALEPILAPPDIVVLHEGAELASGDTLDVGAVTLTESVSAAFSVENRGASPLTLTAFPVLAGPAPGDFAVGAMPLELPPGEAVSIEVTFTPSALGTRSAAFLIPTNDPDTPSFSLGLRGVGLEAPQPDIEVRARRLDFGRVPNGSARTLTLAVGNAGAEPLEVTSISVRGVGARAFSVVPSRSLPGQVPAGRSAALGVRFAAVAPDPATEVPFEATLVMASNDPDTPEVVVRLSGIAINEVVAIDPDIISLSLGLPRVKTLAFDLDLGGALIPVALDLLVDSRGRLVRAGSSTVGDVQVDLQGGKLKLKKATGRWSYALTLKGTSASVSLKLKGELGSGQAVASYKGPEGKFGASAVFVAEGATLDTRTILDLAPEVDEKGKVTGLGVIASGLENDLGAAPGVLKGRVKGEKVSWSLKDKALKRSFSFKGIVDGEEVLGSLKYKLAPGKGKVEGVRIPRVLFDPRT